MYKGQLHTPATGDIFGQEQVRQLLAKFPVQVAQDQWHLAHRLFGLSRYVPGGQLQVPATSATADAYAHVLHSVLDGPKHVEQRK